MPRADVTIRFSTVAPAFAYPVGARINSGTSACSASGQANQVEVNISGAAIGADAGTVYVPDQLWLGDGWDKEFGAIGVNDDFADTVYEYQRIYAPTIPTVPKPTGDVSIYSSNRVNPNASDEYLMFTFDSAVINNNAYRVVFFMKGMSATGIYTITADGSGSPTTPRWFVYCDKDDTSAIDDIKPWNMSSGDRAKVPRMSATNCTDLYFVGLDYGADGFGRQNGCDDITYYRCYAYNFGIHCVGPTGAKSRRIVVFECIGHTTVNAAGDDVVFFSSVADAEDCRVVSCEVWDLHGDFMGLDSGANCSGMICEDNDYYRTLFSKHDGTKNEYPDDTLSYCRGEGFVDWKNIGLNFSSNKCVVRGNRVWAMRLVDPDIHPGSGGGDPFRFSETTNAKWKVEVCYNVFDDCRSSGISTIDGAHLGGGYHSFYGNLINDIRNGRVCWMPSDYSEVYLNTFADCQNAAATFDFIRQDNTDPQYSFDCIGNCLINQPTNSFQNTGRLDSNGVIRHSAIIGTGESPEIGSGSTGTNYENSSLSAMYFEDFRYVRKKLTTREIAIIPNVVPTSSTPAEFRIGCNTDIGDRTNIGVDNNLLREEDASTPPQGNIIWSGMVDSGSFENWPFNTDYTQVQFQNVHPYGCPPNYSNANHTQIQVGNGELLDIVSASGQPPFDTGPARVGDLAMRFVTKCSDHAYGINYYSGYTPSPIVPGTSRPYDGFDAASGTAEVPTDDTRQRTGLNNTRWTTEEGPPNGDWGEHIWPNLVERWLSISLYLENDFPFGGSDFMIMNGMKGTTGGPGTSMYGAPIRGWQGILLTASGSWSIRDNWMGDDMYPVADVPADHQNLYPFDGNRAYYYAFFYGNNGCDYSAFNQFYPDFSASSDMLTAQRGVWTDFIFHCKCDTRVFSDMANNEGFYDLYMRRGSGSWVKVLAIRPYNNVDYGGSTRIYNKGIGVGEPLIGGYTNTGVSIYNGIDRVWNQNRSAVMYVDNFKCGDETCNFERMSPDGSSYLGS